MTSCCPIPTRRARGRSAAGTSSCRRAPDGLHLRTLSDGLTTVDGQPVSRGVDIPVRSGTRIGVADTLNLRLTGATHAATDDDENTTLKRPGAPR